MQNVLCCANKLLQQPANQPASEHGVPAQVINSVNLRSARILARDFIFLRSCQFRLEHKLFSSSSGAQKMSIKIVHTLCREESEFVCAKPFKWKKEKKTQIKLRLSEWNKIKGTLTTEGNCSSSQPASPCQAITILLLFLFSVLFFNFLRELYVALKFKYSEVQQCSSLRSF